MIAIEEECAWATPVDTWTERKMHKTTQEEKDDPRNDPYRMTKEMTEDGFL